MSLPLLVMPLWMQAKIQFAFVSALLHCWIMFSLLLSTRPRRSFLPQLFPNHTDPNQCWLPILPVYPGLSLRWLSLSAMFSSPGGDFGVVSKLGEDTFTKNHRITACVMLEGITGGHPVQPPCSSRVPKACYSTFCPDVFLVSLKKKTI